MAAAALQQPRSTGHSAQRTLGWAVRPHVLRVLPSPAALASPTATKAMPGPPPPATPPRAADRWCYTWRVPSASSGATLPAQHVMGRRSTGAGLGPPPPAPAVAHAAATEWRCGGTTQEERRPTMADQWARRAAAPSHSDTPIPCVLLAPVVPAALPGTPPPPPVPRCNKNTALSVITRRCRPHPLLAPPPSRRLAPICGGVGTAGTAGTRGGRWGCRTTTSCTTASPRPACCTWPTSCSWWPPTTTRSCPEEGCCCVLGGRGGGATTWQQW